MKYRLWAHNSWGNPSRCTFGTLRVTLKHESYNGWGPSLSSTPILHHTRVSHSNRHHSTKAFQKGNFKWIIALTKFFNCQCEGKVVISSNLATSSTIVIKGRELACDSADCLIKPIVYLSLKTSVTACRCNLFSYYVFFMFIYKSYILSQWIKP